jgi:hypothetical protein
MVKRACVIGVLIAVAVSVACQSPTDPDSSVNLSDTVDVSAAPDPIQADTQTGGRTYRVVRGNNQPDDIVPYDWHAIFNASIAFNSTAKDKDVDIDFPVKLTATTLTVKQAVGGIITPPTGTDTEKSEFVPLSATGNQFSDINAPITLAYEVWYDLPNLRKEAIITLSFSFTDNDGVSFTKAVDIQVAP